MEIKRNALAVHTALFTVALIYAANFSIAKWAMPDHIGAFGFILLRVAFGALIFGIYYRLFAYERLESRRDLLQLAVAGFFGVALNMTAFFKGLSMTTPINASVLMLFAPLFVVIFYSIKKRSIHWKIILGVLLAFIGAAFLVGVGNVSLSSKYLKGDLLVILNACSYGFYLVYVAGLLKKYKPTTITAYIFLFGLLYVLPVGYADLSKVNWSNMTNSAWISIGYVCLFVTMVAYFLNSWGIQKSNSALVGSYVYLQPLLASIIAIGLGQDILSIEKTIFAAIIILGVYLVNNSKQ